MPKNTIQINNNCTEGLLKEISFYNNCGLLFKGWSFECGQKIYGNISQYIDALAEEMKSLIPENSDIFEKSDRIMDSLKYEEYYSDQYLTKSMYKILGMLGEYNSRFNFYTGKPRPEYVESFNADENELAEYFERWIRNYKKESRIDFEYTKI